MPIRLLARVFQGSFSDQSRHGGRGLPDPSRNLAAPMRANGGRMLLAGPAFEAPIVSPPSSKCHSNATAISPGG